MDRRGFLVGVAAGAGAAAVGCTSTTPQSASMPVLAHREGVAIRDRMESALAGLNDVNFVSESIGRDRLQSQAWLRDYAPHADGIARNAIKALVVTSAVKELPAGTQAPPVLA